jgi:hypothetical protein
MTQSTLEGPISLNRLGHVYYKHRDLERVHQFLLDFGMSEVKRVGDRIFYRGYGTEPFVYCAERGECDRFGGAGFVVDSFADLEKARSHLPGATDIYDLDDVPGGGQCVTFRDPVDDFPIHLVYGQQLVKPETSFPEMKFNFVRAHSIEPISEDWIAQLTRPTSQQRRTVKPDNSNGYRRVNPDPTMHLMFIADELIICKAPAAVHKLGHFGMCVTNFAKAFEFYTTRFNLKPSDVSANRLLSPTH